MESDRTKPVDINTVPPTFTLGHFALFMLIVFLGSLAAAIVLPLILPGLTESLTGTAPKAFWYLSRGSAFSAYFLLWLSMMLCTGITNKLTAKWPGLPSTIEMHQFTSILGLFFGLFHGMILMADQYMSFTLAQVLLPFSTAGYKPLAVGLGQVGFYTMLLITLSFYIRKKIGSKTWRAIHFISFATYISVLLHAVLAGTDASTLTAQYLYLFTSGLLFFMILYRILSSLQRSREKRLNPQGS